MGMIRREGMHRYVNTWRIGTEELSEKGNGSTANEEAFQVHNESMGYQSQTLHHGEDVGGMKDSYR